MERFLPTLLVLALLGGTVAAFVVTENLKLQPSPIARTDVDKIFSPICDCLKSVARIGFSLREADRLTVTVIDEDDDAIRTLAESEPRGAGFVMFEWNGRNDAGQIVGEGEYRPRVRLLEERDTIVLPNPIRVDTTPPRVTLIALQPRVLSPDGDRRHDRIVARYRISEPGQALLLVNGRRRVQKRGQRTEGQLEWYGRLRGRALPAGAYRIQLAARDVAGNLSQQTPPVTVTLRYVTLARDVVRVAAARRFRIRVSTDAARVRWRLGRRSGTARPGVLVLRAPAAPGRYRLVVSALGHDDSAQVLVSR